jgi:hypothetical protein
MSGEITVLWYPVLTYAQDRRTDTSECNNVCRNFVFNFYGQCFKTAVVAFSEPQPENWSLLMSLGSGVLQWLSCNLRHVKWGTSSTSRGFPVPTAQQRKLLAI